MNEQHAQHVAAFLRWCMQSGTPMPYNLLQAAAQSWDQLVAEGKTHDQTAHDLKQILAVLTTGTDDDVLALAAEKKKAKAGK